MTACEKRFVFHVKRAKIVFFNCFEKRFCFEAEAFRAGISVAMHNIHIKKILSESLIVVVYIAAFVSIG